MLPIVASTEPGTYIFETQTTRMDTTRRVSKQSKSSDDNLSRVLFAEGVQWKVFEHERLSHTLERTLVFSPTEGAVRRVSKYPRNWRSLDDAALFALSQQKQ